MMSNSEIDYDQLETAILHTADSWLAPPTNAVDYADGHNPIYLLSVGPFNLEVGDTLPFTFAYIAGENFHYKGKHISQAFDPYNPYPYKNSLEKLTRSPTCSSIDMPINFILNMNT